jgi:hypothetical protein
VKVESLLQREGCGPVERTGPIPLPGRGPRHSSGRRVPARPTAGAPGVDPGADTEPVAVPVEPTPAVDPAVPRNRGRASRATVLIALAALAAALGAAGIAVAAWLSSGSGRPGVSAGTAPAPTTGVSSTAQQPGLLTPGTAIVTVNNPSPYRVKVLAIAPRGTRPYWGPW